MTILSFTDWIEKNLAVNILLIFFFIVPSRVTSQEKPFALQNRVDKIIGINKEYNQNLLLKLFKDETPISGLAVSCNIKFQSDTSLVRMVLIDDQYNEFLVFESFPLLSGAYSFSVTDYAEETSVLNNIVPYALRIEIIGASVNLKNVVTSRRQKFISERKTDIHKEQNSEKIKNLNANLQKKGTLWIAGETSVSKLSYQQRKVLLGGKIPNLQGFEYYSGGIFVMPGTEFTSQPDVSKFADEFSWKLKHGQDWITSVKNQGGCGSCWAFGAIGATELLVNLYYNQHLNLNLSEQDVLSCSLAGSCIGGAPSGALDFIKNTGVVNEECFPYSGWDVPCSEKCVQPLDIVRIGNHEWSQYLSLADSTAKKMIIEGPVVCTMSSWSHVLTVIGYKVIREGDYIFDFTVPAGHPYIGRTVWLFKNSWGEDWGDEGYLYSLSNIDNLNFDALFPLVSSLNFKDSDVLCVDEDSDGYYNWGIGPKPSHCPPCPDQPDGDDSNPCLGPMDKYGNVEFFTALPVAHNITVLKGDTIPDLYAEGVNIRWYGDRKKTTLLQTGKSFSTGVADPGIYQFFVTQTESGCESDIHSVTLTLLLDVPTPVSENVTLIPGDSSKQLYAAGQNIKWYGDPGNPLYDQRDGQTYKTTLIGNQLWMAENLNFYTSAGSWYYNNDSISYSKPYGRLYYDVNYCPADWHLPTDDEWIEMEIYLGMKEEEAHYLDHRAEGIGSKLKESGTSHWKNPGGTNDVGFNALPAGSYNYNNDEFFGIGAFTRYFAVAEYFSYSSYFRILESSSDQIYRVLENSGSQTASSIRCVTYPSTSLASGNYYKPVYVNPGKYTYYVTQTIFGFESQPDTVVFTILAEVPPPLADDIIVCEKDTIPDLIAKGQNIKWYSDASLMELVHLGNTFSTGKISPGSYKYFVTQSNGNYSSKADSVVLTIIPEPLPPDSRDISICENYMDSTLYAVGTNIKWYSEDSLVSTGNILLNRPVMPGFYQYFVTQSTSGCESQYDSVQLIIYSLPESPISENLSLCENRVTPEFIATGEAIQWYADSARFDFLKAGNYFLSDETKAGRYQYYVTQTINNCESKPAMVELTIYELPDFSLGKDTAISHNENLILGPFTEKYHYKWFDGSINPYYEISGSYVGDGWHNFFVTVTDSNSCTLSDTIMINILPLTVTEDRFKEIQLRINPNPANKVLNIDFFKFKTGEVFLKLIDLNGNVVYFEKTKIDTDGTRLQIDISSFPPGIYLLKVISSSEEFIHRVVVL